MILKVGDKVKVKGRFDHDIFIIEKIFYLKNGSFAMLEDSVNLEFLTSLEKVNVETES